MKHSIASIAAAALLAGNVVAQQRPNIILFLVDDMGWQDTSLPFGKDTTELNRVYETPNMERLARKGVRFTHAYASSISSPSRVSLFTGANAVQHKVTNWTLKKNTPTDRKDDTLDFEAWNCNGLCPEPGLEHSFYAKCLPQLLRENGYTTMMVGKAHFGSIGTPAANPLAIGFDYNVAGHAAGAMGSYLGEEGYGASGNPERAAIWAVPGLEKYHGTDTFLTEALTLEAKELMDKALGLSKPFFLYMSHYAVHAPFGTDKRFYQKYMDKGLTHKEAQYAALLEGMDKSLGDLMEHVVRKGIADNTVIIFMSDNGGYTIGREGKNFPLSEGKGSLKEGGIREPMIVYYPKVTKPSTVCDTPVIIEDFFPTLLQLAGVRSYQVPQLVEGQSFVAQIEGKAGDKERALFFHYPNNWGERVQTTGMAQSAVVKGDWKLIHYYETGSNCLYHLVDDISEEHDLSVRCPDKAKELAKVLSDYLREQHATMPMLKSTGRFVPYPDGGQVERTSTAAVSYEKHVSFPEDATIEEKLDMASRLVPTPQQLEWQRMELTAFLHFGVNTFTGREWGDGTENPAVFNPAALDCEQWVRTLKEAGFKMAVITAKHHDGFCLWPTKTTRHSVAASPWKNGKGDVVRELRDACSKYGIKFGIYLSPWDRNASCYGDSPAYNRLFIRQLTELLTGYGEVHEVWFDGANGEGPNGKKQIYDWEAILKTIRHLQPEAVTAIMGDDVRWVGNEKGIGRETEWSATALTPGIYPHSGKRNKELGIYGKAKDLGGRELVARATGLFWYPSEVDVSIRPGWFYHADQDNQVKTLKQLADIYFKSVGYNSVLLLNIPPDRRGLIHENDVQRLKELATYLKKTFAHNYVIKGNEVWCGTSGTTYLYEVQKGALVNTFMIKEDISKGQRIESFLVEACKDGSWFHVAEGTTVGHKRLVRFSDIRPEHIRVTIRSARGMANVSAAGLFYAEPLAGENEGVQVGDVPTDEWRVVGGDADARLAVDGDRKTVWRASALIPLVVDMGREVRVNGFCYAPSMDEDLTGTIYKYSFFVSLDGKSWTECATSGEFGNIMHNPIPCFARFGKVCTARYFKLVPLAEVNGKSCVSIAEIGILADKVLPKDDETLVYDRPGASLAVSFGSAAAVKPGAVHPKLKGWHFFTAHEFMERDTQDNLPLGFDEHRGRHMSRTACVDNARCSEVKDGVLQVRSIEEPDSIDNGFGEKVKYSHGCYRTPLPGSKEFWCNFTENMRIEIRFRRNAYHGFNDALWFMGNNNRPWPKNGEIDLLENPKKTLNNRSHFTLHSENYYAGVVGGSGSVTSSIELADMSQWNIYWMEWYPDRIVGGVNGQTYFEHCKGDGGNADWPWSDPEGFFLIFSTGISTNPKAWPGAIIPSEWKKEAMPAMYIDWIRVYVNDDYKGEEAPAVKYY